MIDTRGISTAIVFWDSNKIKGFMCLYFFEAKDRVTRRYGVIKGSQFSFSRGLQLVGVCLTLKS